MATVPDNTAFERAVRPVLELLFPEKADEVLRFQPDAALLQRVEELAARCTEGDLSEEERAEYEGYVPANKFVATLQRQARRLMNAAD